MRRTRREHGASVGAGGLSAHHGAHVTCIGTCARERGARAVRSDSGADSRERARARRARLGYHVHHGASGLACGHRVHDCSKSMCPGPGWPHSNDRAGWEGARLFGLTSILLPGCGKFGESSYTDAGTVAVNVYLQFTSYIYCAAEKCRRSRGPLLLQQHPRPAPVGPRRSRTPSYQHAPVVSPHGAVERTLPIPPAMRLTCNPDCRVPGRRLASPPQEHACSRPPSCRQ